jgi:hypothetical protein
MKPTISSLPEAVESLNAVTEFLVKLSVSLGVPVKTGDAKIQHSANGKIPRGTSEQVIQILTDSQRPLMPKDIVNRHQDLGWPAPEGGRTKLYEAVAGSLSYLLNRKGILTKSKKGYSIKHEEKQ